MSRQPGLDEWIVGEARLACGAMLRAISATGLVTERSGLGQRIVPHAGSILASPVPAHYDPDPDYFFHWFRDSALVIDALRVAYAQGQVGDIALLRLREFVEFSLALRALDGREYLRRENFRARARPELLQYLRPEEELAALRGDAVSGDVRVNADGTPDIMRWSRPQSDGPALRALALLRWWPRLRPQEGRLREAVAELVDLDLAFTLEHAHKHSVDVWEEERSHHYYTQLVQAEALRAGARWLEVAARPQRASECAAALDGIEARLAALWSDARGFYRSRVPVSAGDLSRELDIAVILAVLHAGRLQGEHSVLDPRAQATLTALEELFEAEYPINRDRPADRGAALGRYAGDRYYSGGAYFFSTLAAAEFYFRLAAALEGPASLAVTQENRRFRLRLGLAEDGVERDAVRRLALERGDAFMRTVRAFTPASGELSEQFDRSSGAQTSAKQLSWSYAAFITAAASRSRARHSMRAADAAAPPADTG
jgi:glucoamylase